ncbi:cbb3-type cytochrome c oxidase subunit 3 [Actibacterium lipolyticum]|uniref:Cbb3-type cytochrome oxidase component FixQ n=1 Tax=Actibacterium lipolyticum TaxID=1524263 RepID=A0A238KQD5_9RHOB|nr:cbb3-type cytochrome c oxidase subunit 3 [Actibacterium lipolyticum]SMX45069.1 Cbb3-type cytochrome oxidase component FixQ [Actibacterium lipolyticum]
MDMYSITRQFADSWALLFLTLFFVGVVVWVFRPGSTPGHKESANIPFQHEDKPASDADDAHIKEART